MSKTVYKSRKGYLAKATDPHQYDSLEIDWGKEGAGDSPARQFFQEYLKRYLEDLNRKTVVDIGSGTGSLFTLFKNRGARSILGIEPSVKNIAISRRMYPDVPVFQGTLGEFRKKRKFDVAVAVMVFEHIIDLDSAFIQVAAMLNPGGILYLIAGDKEYQTTPRFGYELDVEEVGNSVVIVRVKRKYGLLYDILRPTSHFDKAGKQAGFVVRKHIGMKPTKKFLEAEPKYKQFKDIVLTHLFMFRLSGEAMAYGKKRTT